MLRRGSACEDLATIMRPPQHGRGWGERLVGLGQNLDPKHPRETCAENGTRLLAYHFTWPGTGHVAKQTDGFRYYPEGMTV